MSGGLTSGVLTSGGLTSGVLTSSRLTSGGLTSGGLTPGGLTSCWLTPGGLTSGGLTSDAPSADIDECQLGGHRLKCQHICNNFAGSYECQCFTGYTITKDAKTCVGESCCADDPV